MACDTVAPEQVALLVPAARTGRLRVLGVERAASTERSAGCEKRILGRHDASALVLYRPTAIKGLRIRIGPQGVEIANEVDRGEKQVGEGNGSLPYDRTYPLGERHSLLSINTH